MPYLSDKQFRGITARRKPPKPAPKKKDPNISPLSGKKYAPALKTRLWVKRPERYKSSKMSEHKRLEFFKERFGYSSHISRDKAKRIIKDLRKEQNQAKTSKEQWDKKRQGDMLKELLGD